MKKIYYLIPLIILFLLFYSLIKTTPKTFDDLLSKAHLVEADSYGNIKIDNIYNYNIPNSKFYILRHNNYNRLFLLSDNKTYIIGKQTTTPIGNDDFTFYYEIARIIINKNNPNKSLCTFNYEDNAKNVKYINCSPNVLAQNIPRVALEKSIAFNSLETTINIQRRLDLCGYDESALNKSDLIWCKKVLRNKNYQEVINNKYNMQIENLRQAGSGVK